MGVYGKMAQPLNRVDDYTQSHIELELSEFVECRLTSSNSIRHFLPKLTSKGSGHIFDAIGGQIKKKKRPTRLFDSCKRHTGPFHLHAKR